MTSTTIYSNVLEAYVYMFLNNISTDTLRCIIDNGPFLLGYVPVQFGYANDVIIFNNAFDDCDNEDDITMYGFTSPCSEAIRELVVHTFHIKSRNEEMNILHNAIEYVVDPLLTVSQNGIMATTKDV